MSRSLWSNSSRVLLFLLLVDQTVFLILQIKFETSRSCQEDLYAWILCLLTLPNELFQPYLCFLRSIWFARKAFEFQSDVLASHDRVLVCAPPPFFLGLIYPLTTNCLSKQSPSQLHRTSLSRLSFLLQMSLDFLLISCIYFLKYCLLFGVSCLTCELLRLLLH